MIDFFEKMYAGIIATSFLEWLAVITSILYVIFAAKKMIICWFFGMVTSLLYIYICYTSQLYIESVLQIFYVIMAVVGWVLWSQTLNRRKDIVKWGFLRHLLIILICAIVAIITGYLFDNYTNQANPYIDAFTTSYSFAATFMVTKKVLSNWLYWIVIDVVSVYLYAQRDLQLTSVLFVVFTAIAIVGYINWQKDYKRHRV